MQLPAINLSGSSIQAACLDPELLHTLSESRVVVAGRREEYNNIRPHRSLGLLPAIQFAKKTK